MFIHVYSGEVHTYISQKRPSTHPPPHKFQYSVCIFRCVEILRNKKVDSIKNSNNTIVFQAFCKEIQKQNAYTTRDGLFIFNQFLRERVSERGGRV